MRSIWDCGKFKFNLDEPIIMGILNITPDSFSDGGSYIAPCFALDHAHKLIEEGATIIDVGGESTRPGSTEVNAQEELSRVLEVVRILAAEGIPISIDTRHPEVAAGCVEAGACIINDVSGFRDACMREIASSCDAGLVVMHMQGKPETMNLAPSYDDVVFDVMAELERLAARLEAESIDRRRICIDPGVGFGKNTAHNLALVQATAELAHLGFPIMAAVSRKSFIGAVTGIEDPKKRDLASALCASFMVGLGARVIRTHNVIAQREAQSNSVRAVIGLGSNLGDSCAHLDGAIAALRKVPGIWVGAVSNYVKSSPAYYENQPLFTNAIAVLQTILGPYELLDVLHRIEDDHGRVRVQENGPRSLDLDIVDIEGAISDEEALTLPHPLAHERDFVVAPLLSLLPDFTFADGSKPCSEKASVGRIVDAL